MKDIKSYIIGFLTCACMFLIMGQTKSEANANMEQVMKMANKMKDSGLMPEPVGRYQISISSHKNTGVYETTIDTRTGKIFKREKVKYNQYDKID